MIKFSVGKFEKKVQQISRINDRTNIKNFFPRIFYKTLAFIKYKHVYFFDANIIARPIYDIDNRLKKLFTWNKSYFVLEEVYNEAREQITNKKFIRILDKRLCIINFEDLRCRHPEICPLYYYFISKMYNPATINSLSFFFEKFIAQRARGHLADDYEKKSLMRIMDKVVKSKNNTINTFGETKTDFEKTIDKSFFISFKKKKQAIKTNPEKFFNDYKNLSLALIYCLLEQKNVTLVTADHDMVANFYTLIEAISQELTFKKIILDKLDANEKRVIMNGRKITYYIDKKEFDKTEDGIRADILNHDWKKGGFYFRVKFWDKVNKKYINDFYLKFDESMRDVFLNLHGNLSCHFSQNNTHINWLHILYWWPPSSIHDLIYYFIKVVAWKKKIINKNNIFITKEIHQKYCKYFGADQNNKLYDYVGFWC